jgi:hypothetical protein
MYFIDAIFIIDILINFISVYEDKNRVGYYTYKEIYNNYIQTWFFVDLFSILPFDIIFRYAQPQISLSDSYNRILKSIKLIYVFNKIEEIVFRSKNDLQNTKKKTAFFKRIYFLFISVCLFSLASHVIACIWIFIGKYSLYEKEKR